MGGCPQHAHQASLSVWSPREADERPRACGDLREQRILRAMTHAFDGCRVKLARADHHLEDLEARARAFYATNPYTTSVHHDHETSEFRITLERSEQPPLEWGAIVGEVLYNLRSALDHLAWELARLDSGREPPSNTEFPIFKDRGRFEREGTKRIEALSPAHQALIEGLQPYNRSDPASDPLWLLYSLRNIDQHRTLHVVAAVMSKNSLGIVTMTGYEIHNMTVASSTEAGANIVTAKLVRTLPAHLTQLHMKHDIGVEIRLREGLGDRQVLQVLDEIRKAVHQNVFPKFKDEIGLLPE